MRLQMATISQIEEKYARMSLLLYSITPRAVRVLFDKEFDPSTLDSAIKRAYHSLLDMRNNRIISKPQWDLLFISVGGPDSKTFDITLMISLLTNLTKLTKYNDELPFATDFSPSADLARIKYYRNQLSHNKDGTMNSRLFNAAWGDISGAVGRLGGRDLLDECTQMKTRTLEQSTVPWNRRVQIKKTLEKWKTNDSSFIETEGAKAVLKCVKENSCVTITASSGVGKTSTLRHVVLQMEDEGYTILPITNPHDIQVFYNPNQKSVFVIDDFCGTYSINQTSFDNWKTAIGDIKEVIEDKVTKIVVACRLQVYQENKFKSLSIFRTCVCNMLSEDFCLSRSEKLSIAELYMDKKSSDIIQYCDLYDFFPLLCKLYNDNTFQNVKDFFQHPFAVIEAEIEKLLESEDYGKYCVLVLCVMFNNVLIENWFTEEIDNETKMIIGNTCEACRLPVGTSRLVLLDQINVLQYTFIKKEYGVYRTVHDKIFDFLASYFGKKMINCLIRNAYNRVIMERFLLDKNNHEDQNITLVPPKYHDLYVVRMITDWSKGQPSCVFNNINMKIPKFRLWLLNHLKTQAVSFQKKLAHASCKTYRESVLVYCCYFDDCIPWIMWCLDLGVDVNQCDFVDVSPLSISAQEGHIEVVKVLLENKADINKCDINGASPLFFACEENHLDIVKVLLDKKADINMSTHDTSFYSSYVRGKDYVKRKHAGESPLFIACHENHIEIVKVLLSHRADVNKQRDDGLSPLSIACQRNHIEIVELLLNKKADIKKCAGMKLCPCCIACLQNHVEIVKVLLDNKVDINKCETGKASHLLIACQKNRIEMVKVLLDNKANVNRCTDEGVSPLFIACQMNHIEIVQALIDKNADINRCAPMNTSPLYTACHQNHKEIVKLLLDNKADINKCVNNFFSPLFIACENFHIEIVKLLLDDKADIHELETYPLFSIKKK